MASEVRVMLLVSKNIVLFEGSCEERRMFLFQHVPLFDEYYSYGKYIITQDRRTASFFQEDKKSSRVQVIDDGDRSKLFQGVVYGLQIDGSQMVVFDHQLKKEELTAADEVKSKFHKWLKTLAKNRFEAITSEEFEEIISDTGSLQAWLYEVEQTRDSNISDLPYFAFWILTEPGWIPSIMKQVFTTVKKIKQTNTQTTYQVGSETYSLPMPPNISDVGKASNFSFSQPPQVMRVFKP